MNLGKVKPEGTWIGKPFFEDHFPTDVALNYNFGSLIWWVDDINYILNKTQYLKAPTVLTLILML